MNPLLNYSTQNEPFECPFEWHPLNDSLLNDSLKITRPVRPLWVAATKNSDFCTFYSEIVYVLPVVQELRSFLKIFSLLVSTILTRFFMIFELAYTTVGYMYVLVFSLNSFSKICFSSLSTPHWSQFCRHKVYKINQAGVNEWLRALCCNTLDHGFEHHQYLWICLQVCGLKRFGCHTCTSYSSCHTRGKSEECIARRCQCRHHQIFKTGISMAHKRTRILQIFLKKERVYIKPFILHQAVPTVYSQYIINYQILGHTTHNWLPKFNKSIYINIGRCIFLRLSHSYKIDDL